MRVDKEVVERAARLERHRSGMAPFDLAREAVESVVWALSKPDRSVLFGEYMLDAAALLLLAAEKEN